MNKLINLLEEQCGESNNWLLQQVGDRYRCMVYSKMDVATFVTQGIDPTKSISSLEDDLETAITKVLEQINGNMEQTDEKEASA